MEHLVTTIWQYDIDAQMPATLPAPTPYSQVPLSPCLSHRMAEPGQCGAGAPRLPLRTRAPAPNVCRTTMREFRAAPNATTHVLCPVQKTCSRADGSQTREGISSSRGPQYALPFSYQCGVMSRYFGRKFLPCLPHSIPVSS